MIELIDYCKRPLSRLAPRGNRFTRGSPQAKDQIPSQRLGPILLLNGPGAWNHDMIVEDVFTMLI